MNFLCHSAMRMLHGSIATSGYCADAACAPSSWQRNRPGGIDDPTRAPSQRKEVRLKMAYANNSRVASFGLVDRIMAFVATAKAQRAQRAVYLRTVRELEHLSDRELSDLGIARISIEDVARVAAFGK
jgi:uncharacterized protein YjiS (DUF1127 family)